MTARGAIVDRSRAAVRCATLALVFLSTFLTRPVAGEGTEARPEMEGVDAPSWTEPVTGMRFRRISAGTFEMGANPDEPWGSRDEPRHTVVLTRDLWVGTTEVTQAQWRSVMGSRPAGFARCGPDCPVETVSWVEAAAFANALSARAGLEACYEMADCRGRLGAGCPPGRGEPAVQCLRGTYRCGTVRPRGPECLGYRLPTEAEWEFGARASAETSLPSGPMAILGRNHAPELGKIAWYAGNSGVIYRGAVDCRGYVEREVDSSRCGPHPVATKTANAWGLHDVLGNVAEWVEDAADARSDVQVEVVTDTYVDDIVDPVGRRGDGRIVRGGSWYTMALNTRLADRAVASPAMRMRTIGFRLVRTVGAEGAPAEAPSSEP